MPGQMQRIVHKQVGEELLEALRSAELTLEALLEIYCLANANFTRTQDDLDPGAIMVGLQAQALAVITLAGWLDALGLVLGQGYSARAAQARENVSGAMEDVGVVIPLPNPL